MLKIRLLQCYVVLWMHNIDANCIIPVIYYFQGLQVSWLWYLEVLSGGTGVPETTDRGNDHRQITGCWKASFSKRDFGKNWYFRISVLMSHPVDNTLHNYICRPNHLPPCLQVVMRSSSTCSELTPCISFIPSPLCGTYYIHKNTDEYLFNHAYILALKDVS